MEIKALVSTWFEKWETGDYLNIPVSDDFRHTSPYGTIDGKEAYLNLIEANKEKFLNNLIKIEDEIYEGERACVRYTVSQGDFSMEVSEWLYKGDDLIKEIIAYYNIEGEISEDRKLSNPD